MRRMAEVLKIIFFLKKPSLSLNLTGFVLLGAVRLIFIFLALFVIGSVFLDFISYVPDFLKADLLELTAFNSFYAQIIAGFLFVILAVLCCCVAFVVSGLFYVLLLFIGGAFNE